MPIISYKNSFKNIESLKKCIFTISFDLQYNKYGFLDFKNENNKYFDVGDYRILIEKVFEEFSEEIFTKYDNGIYILSICKYLVDKIPNIYTITYEENNMVDIYYKDEIINAYNEIEKAKINEN